MKLLVKYSHFHMRGKPTAQSYRHATESKTAIQPITAWKIIAQPIRMLGHGTVTARHKPYRNYLSLPLVQKGL